MKEDILRDRPVAWTGDETDPCRTKGESRSEAKKKKRPQKKSCKGSPIDKKRASEIYFSTEERGCNN